MNNIVFGNQPQESWVARFLNTQKTAVTPDVQHALRRAFHTLVSYGHSNKVIESNHEENDPVITFRAELPFKSEALAGFTAQAQALHKKNEIINQRINEMLKEIAPGLEFRCHLDSIQHPAGNVVAEMKVKGDIRDTGADSDMALRSLLKTNRSRLNKAFREALNEKTLDRAI